ncbi:hypothetical protein F5Y11DRAFT_355537 [Daldinia sp. FL1419]|nr:hypothetical protein F5Y11DRAFT_355537 [Daldinia sp. FL1419]
MVVTGNPKRPGARKLPHKAPSLFERPVASAADYKLRMSSSWTLTDGTYQPIPENKRNKRNVPWPSYIHQSYRSMYGLSTLQLSRDAPITPCAMDVATDHIWKCAPRFIHERVSIFPPNGPGLWSSDDRFAETIFRETEKQTDKRGDDVYWEFKEKAFNLWPIWVEDHWGKDWVLIAWWSQPLPGYPDWNEDVRVVTIYDARRDPKVDEDGIHWPIPARHGRLQRQITNFFQRAGLNISNLVFTEGQICPMPLEESTSGERCFAAVKELIGHIIEYHIGIARNEYQDMGLGFWDLSTYVNPYQQRIEMTGINAWVLMATFDYNARICVQSIDPDIKSDVVADGQRRVIKPFDLAGPSKEPYLGGDDYALHPQIR